MSNSNHKQELGNAGELIACNYLLKKRLQNFSKKTTEVEDLK